MCVSDSLLVKSWPPACGDSAEAKKKKKKKKAADARFKAALTCLFHFQTVYSTQLEPAHQHRNKLTLEHIDRMN